MTLSLADNLRALAADLAHLDADRLSIASAISALAVDAARMQRELVNARLRAAADDTMMGIGA